MENGNVRKIKILLASLLAVVAAMADIYVIVNAPHNYVVLGVTSLILLVAVYLLISGIVQLRDVENLVREEQYSNLITAQKACYLQIRRGFREDSRKINELDKKIVPIATAGEVNHRKISGLLDLLMQDQKKVAKLTVSRSKENANAMMNSNDKVIEEMLKMQEIMNDIIQKIADKTEDNQSADVQTVEFAKIEQGQQELLAKIQQLEDSLRNQIENVSDEFQKIPEMEKELISEFKSEIKVEAPVIEKSETQQTTEEIPEPANFNRMMSQKEISALLAESQEKSLSEEMKETELWAAESEQKESVMPDMPNTNRMMSQEEISALLAESVEEPLAGKTEEPVMEETELLPEESSVVSEAVKPGMADANKMLSPEEIAALIAGGVEESLPEKVDEPVIEETAAAKSTPDLSDPNKVMSPEDIAALIANM